jgi:hypothetical protein
MIWIDRVPINTDIAAVTAQLDLPLRRIVTRLTQTLQLASDKVGPIAPVRRDVINHVRSRHDSALQAKLAQRMLHQLKFTQPLPTGSLVEAIPRNWIIAKSCHNRAVLRS